MIRAAGNCRSALRRSMLWSSATAHLPATILPPSFPSQGCPNAAIRCHAYSRSLSSAATAINEDETTMLPPNLTFDRRSSFAPKELPILVPPEDFDSLEGGGDDQDYEEAEAEADQEISIVFDTPRHVVPLPDRLRAEVRHGNDASVTGTLWLDSSLFGVDPIRVDLIKQSVDYIRNKIRGRRKAKSKTIGEVSGSGRKVRQQKGTGQARAGHSRPAHWRGGAKAHGPKNTTDYGNVKMNKKAKRLAMASTLSQKLKEGNLIVIDDLSLNSHKTAPWASILENAYGIGREGASALIVDHYHESEDSSEDNGDLHASFNGVPINLWVASGNVAKIKVVNQRFANVYDILKKDKLILTLSAIEQMETRWKN